MHVLNSSLNQECVKMQSKYDIDVVCTRRIAIRKRAQDSTFNPRPKHRLFSEIDAPEPLLDVKPCNELSEDSDVEIQTLS